MGNFDKVDPVKRTLEEVLAEINETAYYYIGPNTLDPSAQEGAPVEDHYARPH
jgi:hypothetical protein